MTLSKLEDGLLPPPPTEKEKEKGEEELESDGSDSSSTSGGSGSRSSCRSSSASRRDKPASASHSQRKFCLAGCLVACMAAGLAGGPAAFARCTSSLAMAASIAMMPQSTPMLYRCCVALVSTSSLLHHILDETLSEQERAESRAWDAAFRVDSAAICGTCAAFFACLCHWLALPYQLVPVLVAACIGLVSQTQNFKLAMFGVTSICGCCLQPELIGRACLFANQGIMGALFMWLLRAGGRWQGAAHLWAWHFCSGVFLWCGSRALVAHTPVAALKFTAACGADD